MADRMSRRTTVGYELCGTLLWLRYTALDSGRTRVSEDEG